MLIGQLIVWLALALGISRFDTSSLVRRRWRRGVVGHEAPLMSIDAPIVPLDEAETDTGAPGATPPASVVDVDVPSEPTAPAEEPAVEIVDAPTEAGVE